MTISKRNALVLILIFLLHSCSFQKSKSDFNEAFNQFDIDKNVIDVNIYNILHGGCEGNIDYKRIDFKDKKEVHSDQSGIIKVSKRVNGPGLIASKELYKEDPFGLELKPITHIFLSAIHERSLPSIELGKIYATKYESSGGTLEKGTYRYKYMVTKGKEQKLEVQMTGEVYELYNHMPLEHRYTYKLNCVGKILTELKKEIEIERIKRIEEMSKGKIIQ